MRSALRIGARRRVRAERLADAQRASATGALAGRRRALTFSARFH
ncbi:hypothetical protein BURMUCGD1_4802 [Burkholderia multivorans CGD1]|nr:hypothetical protein BURMUCGD1_4802 [Burkholderia multivorans CGD1]